MEDHKLPKKRGRPRKNIDKPKITTNRNNELENIVCFLALSDDEKSADNNFTVNDTETRCNKVINSITEDTSEDMEDINREYNSTMLLAEIKKRDQIIANLRNKTCNNSAIKMNNINYHCTLIKNSDTGKIIVPQQTTVKCWWCDENFDTVPVYIPNGYKDNAFYVFGNFCSFNCAGRYNATILNDYKCQTRLALLNMLKVKTTGSNEPIKFAPARELLASKGGPMNVNSFRSGFLHISSDLIMSMPPLIPLIHTIEETTRDA